MDVLRRFWQLWKRFGQIIGDFIARVILTVFYFTIFVPFGLGVRLLADPLRLKSNSNSTWHARETKDRTIEDAKRLA